MVGVAERSNTAAKQLALSRAKARENGSFTDVGLEGFCDTHPVTPQPKIPVRTGVIIAGRSRIVGRKIVEDILHAYRNGQAVSETIEKSGGTCRILLPGFTMAVFDEDIVVNLGWDGRAPLSDDKIGRIKPTIGVLGRERATGRPILLVGSKVIDSPSRVPCAVFPSKRAICLVFGCAPFAREIHGIILRCRKGVLCLQVQNDRLDRIEGKEAIDGFPSV